MFIVASIQREDGTYAEVGMNTRTVIGYKQEWRVTKAAKEFGHGKRVRIEYFTNFTADKPSRVRFV